MSGLSYLPSKNHLESSASTSSHFNSLHNLPTQNSLGSVFSLGLHNYQNIDKSSILSSTTSQSMLNNQLPSIPSNPLPTANKKKELGLNSQIDPLMPNVQQQVPQGLYTAPQSEDIGYQLYLNYLGDYLSGDMSQQYLVVVPPQSNTSPISNIASQGRYSSNIPPSYPNYSLSPSLGRSAPEQGATSPSTTHHQPSLVGSNEYDSNVDPGFGASPSSNAYMMPGSSTTPNANTRNSIQNTGLYVMAGPNTVNPVPVSNPSSSSMFPSTNTQHPLLFSNMYVPPVQVSGSKGSSIVMPVNAKDNTTGIGSHQSPLSQQPGDHQGMDIPSNTKSSTKKGKVRKNSTSSTSSTGARSSSSTSGQPKPPAKRSRMGCLTCRQRKKRCCETRPRCTECARLKLNCVWPIPGSEHKNKPKEVKNNEQTIDHEIYGKIKVLRGIVEYRSK